MYPTTSTPKRRRLLAAAASAALALGGLGAAAPAAHASTTQVARPSSYAPVANGSCMDGEINGGTKAAYPISCSPPSFPALWNASAKSQTQTADITLFNTSSSTLHLVPIDFTAANPGYGDITVSESIPDSYLPAGHSETITWTETLRAPIQTQMDGSQLVLPGLGGTIRITNFGTDPNAAVVWGGDYPAIGAPSYSVALTASSTSPTTGSSTTITAKNTGSTTEDITLCAAGRAIAAGRHTPGTSLEHAVSFDSAGSRTFTAYAGATYGCSGTAESLVIDWSGSAPSSPVQSSSGPSQLGVSGQPSEPAGQPDPLYVADTQAPGSAPLWLTLCENGHALASGRHNPGTWLTHDVTVLSVGEHVTFDAFAGTVPAVCSGQEATFEVTGAARGPQYPQPKLQVFSAAKDVAFGTGQAPVGTSVPVYVGNTSSAPTWITVCTGGRPVASAWKPSGQSLEHPVVSGKTGTVTYDVFAARVACSGGLEGQTSIDWTAAS